MESEGFSFGSHTCTHPNMTLLTSEALAAEVDRSCAEVTQRLGRCTSFAYPFGMVNDAVMEAVESRHDFSIMLVGGTNHRFDPTRIARVGTDVDSDAALFAQMEIVEPGKAWLRRSAGRLKAWLRSPAGRSGETSRTS
jgi:peptidoglycan/xylan/chitin deacetylase (PgdA/CDA1 family)